MKTKEILTNNSEFTIKPELPLNTEFFYMKNNRITKAILVKYELSIDTETDNWKDKIINSIFSKQNNTYLCCTIKYIVKDYLYDNWFYIEKERFKNREGVLKNENPKWFTHNSPFIRIYFTKEEILNSL